MKKAFVLLVVLSLPVLIFLFLKFYGFNEYEVPVYPVDHSSVCVSADSIVFFVKGSLKERSAVGSRFVSEPGTDYRVVAVLNQQTYHSMESHVMQTARVYDVFSEDGDFEILTLIAPDPGMAVIDQYIQIRNEHISSVLHWEIGHFINFDQYSTFLQCTLGMEPVEEDVNFILIDPAGKIRGYYNSLNEDETERLILELKILKRAEIKS